MTRRFSGDRLVLASHNQGKLVEIGALLKPYGVTLVSAAELGLPVPEETESTFEGNARIKAQAAVAATGLPALADDSGLEIDALGGAPGVYSADWADTDGGRDFGMAMQRVWESLETARAPEPWRARFRSILVLAWPDGHDDVLDGTVEGRIVWPMRGAGGHGYDPIFEPEGFDETFGEMASGEKNRISHRATALSRLIESAFG